MGTDKIVVRNQGEVETSELVNWRGDQATVPQGQSVTQASRVKMARLGARKVVGDRVYRYARAGDGTVVVGDLCQAPEGATGEVSVVQTTAGQHFIGQKTINLYSATAISSGDYAEGHVFVCEGTTPGPMYRIKNNEAISTTSTGKLTLYDTLVTTHTAADQVTVFRNLYNKVVEFAAVGSIPVGVAPVTATTNDYLWLQTWGPCSILHSSGAAVVAKGGIAFPGTTGAVQSATTAGIGPYIGVGMHLGTTLEFGAVFLKIAP